MSAHSMQNADAEVLEAASLWCVRLAEGSLDEADWQDFDAWHGLADNAEAFTQAVNIWQLTGQFSDIAAVIRMRAAALDEFHRAHRRKWRPRLPGQWRRQAFMAASILLAVIVSLTFVMTRDEQYRTGVGERRIAQLSDGTRISLDASSALDVRMTDGTRQIELVSGRARFDVAHDPMRPFTVAAGDKIVVAIGTSFSVEVVDGQLRVTLYEGRVEVRDRNAPNQGTEVGAVGRRLLIAGSELVAPVEGGGLGTVSAGADVASAEWEQGMLSFEGEPLRVAVERINRYTERPIRLDGPSLARLRVDGEYATGDVEAFLEGIASLNDLTVIRRQDEIILRQR